LTVPYLAEKDIIIQFGKLRSKFSQLHTSGSLCNFLLCHSSLKISDCYNKYQKKQFLHTQ